MLKLFWAMEPLKQHSSINNFYNFCHPSNVIRSISKHFLARGYYEKRLRNSTKDILSTKREEYVNQKFKAPQDPNLIFVCTWDPSLKLLTKILNCNFLLLEINLRTAKIFTSKPSVTFQKKMRTIHSHVIRLYIHKINQINKKNHVENVRLVI